MPGPAAGGPRLLAGRYWWNWLKNAHRQPIERHSEAGPRKALQIQVRVHELTAQLYLVAGRGGSACDGWAQACLGCAPPLQSWLKRADQGPNATPPLADRDVVQAAQAYRAQVGNVDTHCSEHHDAHADHDMLTTATKIGSLQRNWDDQGPPPTHCLPSVR